MHFSTVVKSSTGRFSIKRPVFYTISTVTAQADITEKNCQINKPGDQQVKEPENSYLRIRPVYTAMKTFIFSALLMLGLSACAQQIPQELSADVLIKIAIMAAPEEKRADAAVYGYAANGEFTMLREGSNDFICLAPDMRQERDILQAFAYSESLEPFMARGRELTIEGRQAERDSIREAEIRSGQLYMPQTPSTLYAYSGKKANLDPQTGEIRDAKRRYVIYIPYAVAADLGLSSKPAGPGMPWLMDEGTYKAHIMITPE